MLTLYERLPADELPFYLNLMAHLARAGVACPAPVPDRTGALFSMLNGKPAGLVTRVDGAPIVVPDAPHCAAVGDALGRLHVASASYRARLTNRRGPAWWRQAARAVRPFLDAEQNELLAAELKFQTGFGKDAMPRGRDPRRPLLRQRAVRRRPRVRASSTSASPRPTSSPTTSRSPSTTGASSRTATRAGRSCPSSSRRCSTRYQAVRPLDRGRARAVAVAAARRGAALLAVAALRSPPAASGRARARARPGALRAHPARPHRATRAAGSRPCAGATR